MSFFINISTASGGWITALGKLVETGGFRLEEALERTPVGRNAALPAEIDPLELA